MKLGDGGEFFPLDNDRLYLLFIHQPIIQTSSPLSIYDLNCVPTTIFGTLHEYMTHIDVFALVSDSGLYKVVILSFISS